MFFAVYYAGIKKYPHWIYLIGIALGWAVAAVFFFLYITRQLYYQNTISTATFIWKSIIANNISIVWMQTGLCFFLYCFVRYAFYSTEHVPRYCIWLLRIFILSELVLFNPWLYITADSLNIASVLHKFTIYIGQNFYKLGHCFVFSISIICLLWQLFTVPGIRILRLEYLYRFIAMTLLFIIYQQVFGWAPKLLIRVTSVKGYYLYNVPNASQQIKFMNWVFTLSVVFLIILAIMALHYLKKKREIEGVCVCIHQNTKNAKVAMRTFTHSIKNEIQCIWAETEYLAAEYADNKEALYSISLIQQSCTRVFSHLQSTQTLFKNHKYILRKVKIGEFICQQAKIIPRKYPDIVISTYDKSENAMCYIDENAFADVLQNLFTNACEAINEVKHLRNGQLKIEIQYKLHWVSIKISDNGIGMSEEIKNQIFQPFFSTKSSTTNRGIGLCSVYNTIHDHSGQIQVESHMGEGTSFLILLPKS